MDLRSQLLVENSRQFKFWPFSQLSVSKNSRMNTFTIIIIIIVVVVVDIVIVIIIIIIIIINNSNCNIVINILILPSTTSLTLQFNKNKIPRTKMIAFSCVLFLPVLCHKFYLEFIVSMQPKDLLRLNG